jgi:hypothetical protein
MEIILFSLFGGVSISFVLFFFVGSSFLKFLCELFNFDWSLVRLYDNKMTIPPLHLVKSHFSSAYVFPFCLVLVSLV